MKIVALFLCALACVSAFQTQSMSMTESSRRDFIKATGAAALGSAAFSLAGGNSPAYADGPYTLPDLPYAYDALEPIIDSATMKFHHDKHHATYVANVNKALAGKDGVGSILDLQAGALKAGGAVRNSGGGHYNHCFFWNCMGPEKESGSPSAALATAIDEAFGSMDAMKEKFNAAATGQFGSGWAWLGVKADGKLGICGTPNQDNPLMEGAADPMKPILGLDVWEHAYYLKYQNRRPEYVTNFWKIVNWAQVSDNYESYASKGMGVPVEG
uniref:Superoxide dismutase [Fe] n=1 Tax=Heterosigma akashiwo TaxID=2829 RepID=A0A7S3XQ20_HETAK|mmetsp:Transcript_6963/g.10713  ORF Transcript_6963/g.10713 Transcript_6963/m.10713 type:complete len:271 (-) Transcript_6963:269-1081(-)